ncbi:hypothetical protein PMAYCL1PPCAC_22158, partial [Pristionchus mayeri]
FPRPFRFQNLLVESMALEKQDSLELLMEKHKEVGAKAILLLRYAIKHIEESLMGTFNEIPVVDYEDQPVFTQEIGTLVAYQIQRSTPGFDENEVNAEEAELYRIAKFLSNGASLTKEQVDEYIKKRCVI